MRRETSAALVVRYLRTTPLTGSYVLTTRLARGGLGSAAGAAGDEVSSVSVAPERGRGVFMEYLVVMRVCPVSASAIEHRRRTAVGAYRLGAGFHQEGGLLEPLLARLEVGHYRGDDAMY